MSKSKNVYEVTLINDEIIVIDQVVDLWRAVGISDSVSPVPINCSIKDTEFCPGGEINTTCPRGCNGLRSPGDLYPIDDRTKNVISVPEHNNVEIANMVEIEKEKDFLEVYLGYTYLWEKSRLVFKFNNGYIPYTSIIYVRVVEPL